LPDNSIPDQVSWYSLVGYQVTQISATPSARSGCGKITGVERLTDASQWAIGPDQVCSHGHPNLHIDQRGVADLVAPSIARDHESVPLDKDGYGATWQMPCGMEPCSMAAAPWGGGGLESWICSIWAFPFERTGFGSDERPLTGLGRHCQSLKIVSPPLFSTHRSVACLTTRKLYSFGPTHGCREDAWLTWPRT
jgi:hypothetical protein